MLRIRLLVGFSCEEVENLDILLVINRRCQYEENFFFTKASSRIVVGGEERKSRVKIENVLMHEFYFVLFYPLRGSPSLFCF